MYVSNYEYCMRVDLLTIYNVYVYDFDTKEAIAS